MLESWVRRWKQAVVHIECATDSEDYRDRRKRDDELRARMEKGEITFEEYATRSGGEKS
jgi:uncharacterized membrane protein